MNIKEYFTNSGRFGISVTTYGKEQTIFGVTLTSEKMEFEHLLNGVEKSFNEYCLNVWLFKIGFSFVVKSKTKIVVKGEEELNKLI